MTASIFILSKNNRFGLQYQSLDKRWKNFLIYVETRFSNIFNLGLHLCFKPSSELDKILKINNLSTVIDLFFEYVPPFDELSHFRYSSDNILEFLYIFDLFLQDYSKHGKFVERFVGESNDYRQMSKLTTFDTVRSELINSFELFDLDWAWSFKKFRIERNLDETNTVAINENIDKISSDFGYQDCVDEFLKPKTEINFLKSLDHLKRVLERAIQSKGVKSLSSKKAVINLFFTGKSSEELEKQLTFIIKNIHHDQNFTPYKFIEKEYVYWWLQLNSLIYILNSN